MSLLFTPHTETRDMVRLPGNVLAPMNWGRGSSAVDVTIDSAMRHDAVWSCRTRIAEDVSMIPVDVVRYVNGQRQPVEPVPQIVAAPSVQVDAMDWRYQLVMAWTGAGNAFGMVTQTDAVGRYPTRIELLGDETVRVMQIGGEVQFYVNGERQELWPVGNLWHSPAYTMPGRLLGLSPIQQHATIIGKGMAAGLHGFQYFTDGAHPTSIWKLKGANAEQAKSFKERLMGLAFGNREPLTVDADAIEMVQMQSNPTDSQFLETERYSVEQVCRIYNCDPVDHGGSAGKGSITYGNRLDADMARLKRRQYWVTKVQSVLTGMIPRPQVARLNTSAYLMMTPQERHNLYEVRLRNKTMTVNEVRTREDETPFGAEFNEPGVPGADGESSPQEGGTE